MALLEVLIPTSRRKTALATTLAGLFGQTRRDFDVVISDQTELDGGEPSPEDPLTSGEITTLIRAFQLRNQRVRTHRHLPRRGMAEQRQFLLDQSSAPYVLFLDDDLLLEPDVVDRMLRVIQEERCGFVGCAPIGLSHLDDYRPHQHHLEIWEGPVEPEPYTFESVPWVRHVAHNAANPLHLGWKHSALGTIRYKVAWVGACVLYDREKLVDSGGYTWWTELPPEHCGEDVLAQLMVMSRYGGCGVLPSGVYHLELPTEVPNRRTNTDDLIRRYLGASPEPVRERPGAR